MRTPKPLIAAIFGAVFIMLLRPASGARQQAKPNILVIMGDDIGWFNPSCYNSGMMGYRTPNIDRIANEGAASPTGMPSNLAPPVARRSSRGSPRFAPG